MGGVSMEMKEVQLGDILNFRRGHDLPLSSIQKGTIPVAGSNGIIGYHNQATPISPVLTIGRSGNVGKPYFYDEAWAHNTTLYVDDFKGNNPKFLYYLCQTIPFSAFGGGSAVPTLNRNHIHPIIVAYPPDIKDQCRIASILSSLDRKIELNNKINAQLEEMAQALFKEWFVDFGPFKDGKFVESELGLIPEGWRVGCIYEYVNVIYGAPYKSSLFNDCHNGYPLIRIRDLKTCSPSFFSPELLPNTEFVEMGDVVAGMDAEFTPYIWKGEKGLLNQRVCKLTPQRKSVSNLYVMLLMKPHLEYVQGYKTGTTVSHLGKGDIDKFISVLPPLHVVENISKTFDSILCRICNVAQENMRLSQLRDTLLPKLMNGEIDLDKYND